MPVVSCQYLSTTAPLLQAGNWQLATGNFVAAGFVTPMFMTAGLLLAAIPIIIHILNRRRYRIIEWAAMEFLLLAMRKNRRRLRFEQLLLLLTRCAVLAFLGLALARPLGCEDTSLASLAGRRAGLHVIVIDNSYSMAYEADRPDAKTHLDQAKILAKQIIAKLSAGGEAVAVITAGHPASAVIARPAYDLEGARAAIDRIDQSYSGTDVLGALQKALEIGREESAQPVRNLYILTDSTRSAWETNQAEALASVGKELASIYRVAHFNLARNEQWNHAVLSVRSGSNLVRAQFDNEFQALVRGFGGSSESLLQWKFDNQSLPGGGQIKPELNTQPQTQSQAPIAQGGLHVISATLASDNRLKIDDARWRVFDVASELKVLIVEGERGIGPLAGSGVFLQLALAPLSEDGTRITTGHARTSSYVAPELISELELGNKVLGEYRAIILAGVSQLTANEADQLRAFVEQGGMLMLFMGEPVNAESYNNVLLPRGLVPGTLARRLSVSGEQQPFLFDFNPKGSLHSLLSIFANQEKTGLDTAPVFTYWQIDIPADSKVERVLNFLPDDKGQRNPAITVHDLGRGKIVFCATSADWQWTFLPAKPAYVALVHELLSGNVTSGDRWLNRQVGEQLEIPPNVQLSGIPTLKDPQQADIILEQATGADKRPVYRSRPLDRPGVYTLSTGSRTLPVVVNVPDDEADIRPLDGSALRKALGDIDITLMDDQLPAEAASAMTGNDFGWSFMVIVLALVALECFFAMRFGHYKK